MASQLILRIASLFDKTGFEQFKRESGDFVNRLRETQRTTSQLQTTFLELGKVAAGVFAASRFKEFVSQALETDRLATILATRFRILGEQGDATASAALRLTQQFSRLTRFSQTELLNALNVTLRTARSSQEAFEELAVAQDIAAATGNEVALAARAVALAQAGSTFLLARLTGLTSAHIRELREQGRLLDGLREKFGGIAQQEGKTLSGQLAILRNRFREVGESIGRDLLPLTETVTKALAGIPVSVDKVVIELTSFAVAAKAVKSLGLDTLFLGLTSGAVSLSRVLGLVGIAFTGLELVLEPFKRRTEEIARAAEEQQRRFFGVGEALRGNRDAFKSVGVELEGVNNAVAVVEERLKKLDEVVGKDAERQRGIFRQELDRLKARRQTLEEALKAEQKLGDAGINLERARVRQAEALASQSVARLLKLDEEQRALRALAAGEHRTAEELDAIIRNLQAVGEERTRIIEDEGLKARKVAASLAGDIASIFKATFEPRTQIEKLTAQIQEIDQRLSAEQDLRQREELERERRGLEDKLEAQKRIIQQQLKDELAAIAATKKARLDEIAKGAEAADVRRKESQVEELKAQSERIKALREALAQAEPLEPTIGKDFIEKLRRDIEEAERRFLELRRKVGPIDIERITEKQLEFLKRQITQVFPDFNLRLQIDIDKEKLAAKIRENVIVTLKALGLATEKVATVAPAGAEVE